MNARPSGGAPCVSGGLRFAPTIGLVVLWIAGRVSSSAAADAVPTPYVPYHSATLVVGTPTAAAPQPGDGAPIRIVPPSEPASRISASPLNAISQNSRSESPAETAETTIATPLNSTIDAGRLVPVTLPTAAGAPKPATTEPRPKQSPRPRAELKPAVVQPPTTSSMPSMPSMSSMSSGLPPMTAVTQPDGEEVSKPKSAKAKPSSMKTKNPTTSTNQSATTLEAGPLQEIRPPQPPQSAGTAGPKRRSTAGVDLTPPKVAKPAAMKKPAATPPLNLPQPPIPFIEAARKSGRFPGGFRSSRLDRLRSAR